MRLNERRRRTVSPLSTSNVCDCGDPGCDESSDSGPCLYPHDFNILDHFRVEVEPGTVQESPLLFGVELELEIVRGRAFNALEDVFAQHPEFIAKRDGSLSNGIELVTLPLALRQHEDLVALLAERYFPLMSARDSCGMHVHVDRRIFTRDSHFKKFVGFFSGHGETPHAASWQDFLTVLCRRVDNRYCRRETSTSALYSRSMGDRYCAVNLSNGSTIEVRAFAATRNPRVYLANIELIAALIAAVKAGLDEALMTPENFIASILHPDAAVLFPNLAARLARRESADGKVLFRQWLEPHEATLPAPARPTTPEEIFQSNLPFLAELPIEAQRMMGIPQPEEVTPACA